MTQIDYRELEGAIIPSLLHELAAVAVAVFNEEQEPGARVEGYAEQLQTELSGYRWVHLCLAYQGDRIVGYKVGRSNDPRSFESWSGGVLPQARRQGIANELAARQESWVQANGFGYLTTLVAHDNQPMLIVNLKRGFCVAGIQVTRGEHRKVLLEKAMY